MSQPPAVSSGYSYDRLPSEPRPLLATHPDTLAVTALLAGLTAADVTHCRVLEIGCAVGGNLLPLAQALPESTFVGIDLSAKQIAMAQRTATGAGLKNVRVEVKDLMTLKAADFGPFDYIIAHGVYSWVKPAVRDRLIEAIGELLAPNGLAYVNYYIYPGWHGREMFRGLVARHTRDIADPRAVAAEARKFIALLARHSAAAGENLYTAQLRQESGFLNSVPDEYLVHEYLGAEPQAVYFEQFAEGLKQNNLAYVSEIKPNPMRRRLANELRNENPELAGDPHSLERWVDEAQGTFVRRSLICRAGQPASPWMQSEAIERLLVRALALPTVMQGDVRSNDPLPFRLPDGNVVDVSDPTVKTVLVALAHNYPHALRFEDMLQVIRFNLQFGEQFALPGTQERQAILNAALNCYTVAMLDLHVFPPVFTMTLGDKPRATGLARFQARESKTAASVLHTLVLNLTKTDRLVLAHLNGARDRAALVGVLKTAIAKGILPDPAKDPAAAAEAGLNGPLEQVLEQSLVKLANDAFLIE